MGTRPAEPIDGALLGGHPDAEAQKPRRDLQQLQWPESDLRADRPGPARAGSDPVAWELLQTFHGAPRFRAAAADRGRARAARDASRDRIARRAEPAQGRRTDDGECPYRRR